MCERGEVTGSFEVIEISIQGWVGSSDDPREGTSLAGSQERRSAGASQECCSSVDCQDGLGSDCHDGIGASEEFHAGDPADAEAGAMISAARYAGSPSHGG